MCRKIPKRAIIGIHAFLCGIIQVSFQVMISMNILAMVIHKDANDKPIPSLNPNYGKRYDWSPIIQSQIYGAYFWGSLPSMFLSGWFIQIIGSRKLVTYATLGAALLTALIPALAEINWSAVYVARYLSGMMTGVVFPSLHDLVAKWIPPQEKGKFMSLFMSGNLGIYIVWSTLGSVIQSLGWVWAWEIPSILAIVWCLCFHCTTYDNPEECSNISEKERTYILNNININFNQKNAIPLKKILTNCPVWSLFVLSFGNLWGLFFVTTYSPQYMVEILNQDIKSAGRMLGFAFLCRFLSGFTFGIVNDYLLKTKICTPKISRNFFCLFSHFLPGVTMFMLIFVDRNLIATVSLITLCQVVNSAIVITVLLNIQDLSPNYVGVISGLSGGFGTLAGIASPALNGILISHKNSIEMWHVSFGLAGVMYILTGFVFVMFGSSKVQSFNRL